MFSVRKEEGVEETLVHPELLGVLVLFSGWEVLVESFLDVGGLVVYVVNQAIDKEFKKPAL